MNKMLNEYMNINVKHGELSSAVKSPEHKTKCRIQPPSVVFRVERKHYITAGKLWDNDCTCFSVLFKTISDLRNKFARSSGIRLRALLNNACKCTEIFLKLNYKGK